MKKLISIIIVNWNGRKHLVKCFPSLAAQNYKNIETILVDNASNDGSIEYVKKYFPKAKIIVNKTNLGFAQANNIGYKASRGQYILFLNNDTRVHKNFLTELVRVIDSEKKIGCVQSKILLMDKPKYYDSIGSFFTPTGFLYHYGAYKKDSAFYNKVINLYSARGACMMFKREVLEKVKVKSEIFDSKYFAYFEETDLCHRVLLAGYEILYVPSSVIYHKLGGTSVRLDSSFVQYHSYKNRINSYIKNLGNENLIKTIPIHLFLCVVVSLLYLIRGYVKIFFVIQKAIAWNVGNIGQSIKKRKYIQERIREIEDDAFLPKLSKSIEWRYYFYVFFGDLKNYNEKIHF